MPGVIVDGFDFFAVHEAAGEAIARAREGGGPTLIEVKFTRYFGHFEGDQQTLPGQTRSRNARENLDCLKRFRARVTETGRAHRRPARPGRPPRSATLIDEAGRRGQGRAACRAPTTCSPTSTSRTEGEAQTMARKHHLPRGDQRGARPGDGARRARHRHGRGQRRRRGRARARTTPGAACSASPRASTASSRAGCSTPRSRSRRSSAPRSARPPAACGPSPS